MGMGTRIHYFGEVSFESNFMFYDFHTSWSGFHFVIDPQKSLGAELANTNSLRIQVWSLKPINPGFSSGRNGCWGEKHKNHAPSFKETQALITLALVIVLVYFLWMLPRILDLYMSTDPSIPLLSRILRCWTAKWRCTRSLLGLCSRGREIRWVSVTWGGESTQLWLNLCRPS